MDQPKERNLIYQLTSKKMAWFNHEEFLDLPSGQVVILCLRQKLTDASNEASARYGWGAERIPTVDPETMAIAGRKASSKTDNVSVI